MNRLFFLSNSGLVVIAILATLIFIGIILFLTYTLYRLHQKHSKIEKRCHLLKNIQNNLQNKLTEKNYFLNSIFSHCHNGVAITSLDGQFIRANHTLCKYFGYTLSEIKKMNLKNLIYHGNTNLVDFSATNLADHKMKNYETEQQALSKQGNMLQMTVLLSLIRDKADNPIYYLVQVNDVTAKRQAEEQLKYMAHHDALTGLANKSKLKTYVDQLIMLSQRHQHLFALLILDIDRLKNLNSTMGHAAGDILLKKMAKRLEHAVRNADMVGRLVGDEFVILVTDVTHIELVSQIANKIIEIIAKPLSIQEKEVFMTASIGVSVFPSDGDNFEELLKNADLALSRAKELGRHNFQFYSSEITERVLKKSALQRALAHALNENELVLYYQPRMDMKTRRILGVEALLRWKNSEYDTVHPKDIIKLAEETGLIFPISDWIMKTACEQLKKWHIMGLSSLMMSINCSYRQFCQKHFLEYLATILSQTELPPHLLIFEITENTIAHNTEQVIAMSKLLKQQGVQLSIDNFGLGFWSYQFLKQVKIDQIKIAQPFVSQIPEDVLSATIISSMIAMSNKLGITTVAEGVEHRTQFEFLSQEGCKEIQGFYLTKPLNAEEMTYFLMHPVPDVEAISRTHLISE